MFLSVLTFLVFLLFSGVNVSGGENFSSATHHLSLGPQSLRGRGGHGVPPRRLAPQDIDAVVKRTYGRPNDPEVRQGTASRRAAMAIDEVEDALARANNARDASPPDYRQAELAYGFTARLNPRDPRALMGLGNVAYDQKQFAVAAKNYQEALTMVTSMASFGGATLRGELNRGEQRSMASELRVYLGVSLLETKDFKSAQAHFERAIKAEPTSARLHAFFGYCSFKLGNRPEAVKSFQEAVRLDPGNSEYQQLLQFAQQ